MCSVLVAVFSFAPFLVHLKVWKFVSCFCISMYFSFVVLIYLMTSFKKDDKCAEADDVVFHLSRRYCQEINY